MVIYANSLLRCDDSDNMVEYSEENDSLKNFMVISKIMDSDAILKMVEYVFYHHFLSLILL